MKAEGVRLREQCDEGRGRGEGCRPDGGRGVVQEDLVHLCEDRAPGHMQLQQACGHHQAIGPKDVCTRGGAILPPSILVTCIKHARLCYSS